MPPDVKGLIKALTPKMIESLELAIKECVERRNLEVRVEHLLFRGLDVEGSDLRSMLPLVTRNALQVELDAVLDEQRTADRVGVKPTFAPSLIQLLEETRSEVSGPRGESRIRGAAILERLVTATSRSYLAPELLDPRATLGRARRAGGLRSFSRPIASREELAATRGPTLRVPLPRVRTRYRVAKGETLREIARRFAIDWERLATDNHLGIRSVLEEGQSLELEWLGESVVDDFAERREQQRSP